MLNEPFYCASYEVLRHPLPRFVQQVEELPPLVESERQMTTPCEGVCPSVPCSIGRGIAS